MYQVLITHVSCRISHGLLLEEEVVVFLLKYILMHRGVVQLVVKLNSLFLERFDGVVEVEVAHVYHSLVPILLNRSVMSLLLKVNIHGMVDAVVIGEVDNLTQITHLIQTLNNLILR